MISPGEDIKAAREIYAILYGEDEVWKEVNVRVWMKEARKLMGELRLNTLQETAKELRQIPFNIMCNINY